MHFDDLMRSRTRRVEYVVCHSPTLQSFIVTFETHSQGTRRETSSEHGSVLRILPLIITLRARPTTMELQGGLCGVGHSKSGRKPDPYCGSVAIVRFSTLSLSLLLIESLAVFQPGRARPFFGALFRDFSDDRKLIVSRSSTIIEEIKQIRKSSSALVVYYYFDSSDRTKRGARGLLTSVLVQLADASEECWTILSQFHTESKYGSEQPSEAALEQCLKHILGLPGQDPIYIIVDALDECPNHFGAPSAREIVLEFVQNLVQANHSNLFICVTSRPEQDINSILNPLAPEERRVSLHDENGQKEDIIRYVQAFVHSDRNMQRWRENDKKLVIDTLSELAGGM